VGQPLESLEDDLPDDPAGSLSELVDLVEQALGEAGIDLDDPFAVGGDERDSSTSFARPAS
jgi:hypothetical protein